MLEGSGGRPHLDAGRDAAPCECHRDDRGEKVLPTSPRDLQAGDDNPEEAGRKPCLSSLGSGTAGLARRRPRSCEDEGLPGGHAGDPEDR